MKTLAADKPVQPENISPEKPASSRVIRASEIGIYLYCARAWWYQAIQGVSTHRTADLEKGLAAHNTYGRRLRHAHLFRRLAFTILLAGIVLLFIGGILWVGPVF